MYLDIWGGIKEKFYKFSFRPCTFAYKCPWLSRGVIKGGDKYELTKAHFGMVKILGADGRNVSKKEAG